MSARTVNRIVRGALKLRLQRARARASARAADLLTVHARFTCQRWQALCAGHYATDFETKLTAAYAAAQLALEARLRRGVALREIVLELDPINADTFHVRLLEEGRAAA